MIIVDSTVWVDLLRNRSTPQTQWVRLHRDDDNIAILDLIYCEVLQGIRRGENYDVIRTSLASYPVLTAGGIILAEAAAGNYRRLRERGITVRSTIDCLIATCCILDGHALLHSDRDFVGFEKHLGLKVLLP